MGSLIHYRQHGKLLEGRAHTKVIQQAAIFPARPEATMEIVSQSYLRAQPTKVCHRLCATAAAAGK
jgi:hypothetical protein